MRYFVWLFILLASFAQAQTMGGSSGPVIWSGSYGQVLPNNGIRIPYNSGAGGITFPEDPPNGTSSILLRGYNSLAFSRTWTIPTSAADQTVVGDTLSITLTNKGIDCANNTCTNIPANSMSGVVPLANGGTNKNNTAVAGAVAFSDATTIGLTAAGTSGQYLKSAGTGTPVWSAVDLSTSSVTGVLPLANGGTNKNMTAVNGGVVWTDTDSQEVTAAGTSGQFLKSGGAATPTWSAVDLSTSSVTGVLPLANGGTNKNMTASAGAMVYSDADSFELTAVGTNGMTMVSTGTTAPAFAWTSIKSTSSAYSVTTTDGYSQIILTGTTSRQMDLPDAASSSGRRITFTNVGTSSAVLTIARAGTDTIGPLSETTIKLSFTGDSVTLVSDGTANWKFVGGYFQSDIVASTFTFNGTGSPGTSGSVDIKIVRIGPYLHVSLPTVTATSGTSSTQFIADTALPAWAQPVTAQFAAVNNLRNNGGSDANPGVIDLQANGKFIIFRSNASLAWSNAVSCGTSNPMSFIFYLG